MTNPIFAQATLGIAAATDSTLATALNFGPIVLIIIVFYFLLIRPQQTAQKSLKARLAGIRRGDKVVTAGGILAEVAKAPEGAEEIEVDLAPNMRVTVLRSTITTVLTGGKPDAPANDTKPTTKKPAK
ncbi:MAG TPA: preprotein translocase subunit YajC [Acidiphilium sp.]|nr:MAG: preprotein translocase subunit YajC [Acidiphilium sp. 21-60-14]OYV91727.1 MAG: preprotein translocase subunit YajC [Acidiphilium sp. 37-60-79]OZB38602.1 MAG: preprotein translocase subunit YajC [Acidiphilium sp. 34-60-192]HQT87799.1 preprotein translocase subunit YajC [Acidiphilium sp.]HQU23614.1 preprotein translocase subunit YajC [Acidiphilium sp.]